MSIKRKGIKVILDRNKHLFWYVSKGTHQKSPKQPQKCGFFGLFNVREVIRTPDLPLRSGGRWKMHLRSVASR